MATIAEVNTTMIGRAHPLLVLLLAAAAPAAAQSPPPPARPDHQLRAPYITSSGATVDKPGVPQASGPTPLDRSIQRQDNAIDGSLCKGC